jgi:hypothetical protein
MYWIILNWSCPEDVAIVANFVGLPRIFDSQAEAEEYAQKELNWNWQAIELAY